MTPRPDSSGAMALPTIAPTAAPRSSAFCAWPRVALVVEQVADLDRRDVGVDLAVRPRAEGHHPAQLAVADLGARGVVGCGEPGQGMTPSSSSSGGRTRGSMPGRLSPPTTSATMPHTRWS